MDVISIIGVSRGNEYSPNHVDNDAAIFNKVTEELRRLGCEVKVYAEKDFVEQGVKGDIIFDMARDKVTIARLRSLEDEGALVINSAYGIDNCVRKPMTELLIKNGVPHPQSFIISTADEYLENYYPCWVKRGDSHAMVKEDVAYATCKVEVENIFFNNRQYDDITMPAGNYDALRVLIGEGAGQNWWCVLFPAMCLPAAEKREGMPELDDVLTDGQMSAVEGNQYEVKFKTVEIYESIKSWFGW